MIVDSDTYTEDINWGSCTLVFVGPALIYLVARDMMCPSSRNEVLPGGGSVIGND
jgi:hypothetical protein